MDFLSALEGTWAGRGSGRYPTIESFDYEETVRFEREITEPLTHYEQKTRLIPSGEPSHWESGFIRQMEGDAVEILNSQNSGRVEVLRGRWTIDAQSPTELHFTFDSVALENDPRLVRTRRIWTVRDDTLRYEVLMATRTTPEPKLETHLQAVLTRVSREA